MTTNLLISATPKPESKSAQLAQLLPAIETALQKGHGHEVIHDHIRNTLGLDLTYQYYKTTLKRIRKKQSKGKVKVAGVPRLAQRTSQATSVGAPPAADSGAQSETSVRRFTYDVKAPVGEFF